MRNWRPSYLGEESASCLVYTTAPPELTDSMVFQGPQLRMGTRLQYTPCRKHRDHVPVRVTLRLPLRQRIRQLQKITAWGEWTCMSNQTRAHPRPRTEQGAA
eukprot:1808166-Pyramimonas_sp.AAC.1